MHTRTRVHTRLLRGARPRARAHTSQPLCSPWGPRSPGPAGLWEAREGSTRPANFLRGAAKGPRGAGSPPALLLLRLPPPKEGRRTKVSGRRPRGTAEPGLGRLHHSGTGASRLGFSSEASRHPLDILERWGRAAGREEERTHFQLFYSRTHAGDGAVLLKNLPGPLPSACSLASIRDIVLGPQF